MSEKTKDELEKELRLQKRKKLIEDTNSKIDAVFAEAWRKLDEFKKEQGEKARTIKNRSWWQRLKKLLRW